MKIKVKYIHNAQAIEVKGSDWKTAFRKQRELDYWNHIWNGGKVRQWTQEQYQGSKGDY